MSAAQVKMGEWMIDLRPHFHIPCGQWFEKVTKHKCFLQDKRNKKYG